MKKIQLLKSMTNIWSQGECIKLKTFIEPNNNDFMVKI